MKKILAACLLIVMLMLTLVSCTDDFIFIDKSKDNEAGDDGSSQTPSGDNNAPTGNNNSSGGNNNTSNGNSSADDKYFEQGYGAEIPLD